MQPAYVTTAAVRGTSPNLESLVEAFRGAGIPAIELGWAPAPRTTDLESWLASLGDTSFLIHNYFPAPTDAFVLNLASADVSVLARSLHMAEANIRLSSRLGSPFYSVHAGFAAEFRPASLGHTLDRGAMVPREAALTTFRQSIELLATKADEAGIDLLIEPNVVDHRNLVEGRNELLLLAESDEIVEFFVRMNHPRLGLLLDVGHLKVTARTLGFDREEFVEAVAPWVRGLHIHENDGNADQHRPLDAKSWALDIVRGARVSIAEGRRVVVDSSAPTR